ncbi:MAG TPA: molybdopterin cofactor-binding domain-containing protein, partial [Candidatus Acidoferrales bacterium]|nr:molybdopterin cofactor-binding domain-containing protein [Candidatus Acidoferrales bacterium]
DGMILAREFEIVLNSGAYTDNSPLVNSKTANRCFGPYKIPALRVVSRSMFTNTVPASSLRGFGAPQGNLGGELQMDEAAAKLGIDPVDLRLRNLVGPGETLLPGRRPLDADLKDDLRCLVQSLGWPGQQGGVTVGFGVSASDAGAYPTSTAAVRIHSDDSVTLFTGSTELGQGSRTVLSQIVAEELGVPLDTVGIVGGDTGVVTYERTTGASRTTTVTGRAVQEACRDARRRVRVLAADVFKVDATAVADAAAGVRVKDRDYGYGEIIERWFGAGGEVLGHGAVRKADGFAQMPPFYEIGCSGVALSIDRETGVVRIEKLATVGDVGFAINPALVHGQDLGAATMGMGAALREELVYEGGQLVNSNVVDYRVPRFGDQPREIDLMLAERRDGAGPYGAKGAGEGAGNTIGSSVAAAIGRAIGVFPHELPATPQRVWRLLRENDERARR